VQSVGLSTAPDATQLNYIDLAGSELISFQDSNQLNKIRQFRRVFRCSTGLTGVIGPLLLLLYINDIVDVFGSDLRVKLFADDVKIYITLDNIDCQLVLQRGLENLSSWADIWQLKISVPKCAVLHLGSANPYHSYFLGSSSLPDRSSVTDLGITIDHNLKFSQHITNITVRAHQQSALILCCFKSNDPYLLFCAFITYLRPSYSSQV
jgi:hypothetical protein